ncbi:MAG: NADH-quinone oxidoreductase subunit NuoE [Planctomycetota bacterium]|nr:NADH-quinone oxidoreductase subunit NuoE [Planctomycetota bacterium]
MQDRVSAILSRFKSEESSLIPILQEVQAEFSYLPVDAMRRIARFLRVPESRVFGVASFYAQFRFTPMGKNRVMACRGTACHVRGAPRILEEISKFLGVQEGETTPDMKYTLETVACIGCCALAPCVMVNKEVHAKLTPATAKEVFAE